MYCKCNKEVNMRNVGTVVRGIRTPIIKEGDDLANIVVDSLMRAKESEKFEFRDKDIVAIKYWDCISNS